MSNLNLVNFHRSNDNNDNIDTALQQALSNFDETHDPQLARVHHQLNHHHQDKNSVPIDPSIGTASEKEAVAAVAAAAATAASAFARTTAQAAVNSSKVRAPRTQGPKITKPRINKPGQKFGAKKKSWVWNWFIQDPHDCNLATCDFCGKAIKRLESDKGSPKKLGEHLKTHKIDRTSINQRRDHMMNPGADGRQFFNTLNTGTNNFKPHPLSSESQQSNNVSDSQAAAVADAAASAAVEALDLSMFDQSPYTQTKFQREIMKFLGDNKLALSVVKSHSFRQLVYTLKPMAIPDLNELNHLYSSLLDVAQANEKDDDVNVQHQVVVDASGSEKLDNVGDLGSSTDPWV